MTIPVNDRRIQYTATASQTVFPYDFNIDANTEIIVLQTVYTTGAVNTLTLTTHYTVSGVGQPAGGNITLVTGAAVNDTITIVGSTPLSRVTDFNQAGDFLASELNDQLDKITQILQENETETSRAVVLSPADTATTMILPITSERVNKFLAFDADGDPIAAGSSGGVPVTAFMETVLDDATAADARATLGSEQKTSALTAITTLQDADQFLVADDSDNDNSKKIIYSDIKSALISDLPFADSRNLIINGQGMVAQRGTTFTSATTPANSNDTYLLDRMILLSDTNDVVDVSKTTSTVPVGSYSAIVFDQETANKKWGYLQIIEAREAAAIVGGVASLSFKARKGSSNATLENLRAAVLSWSSTTDTVTSSLVSSWGSAGQNPTLVANWTYENIPSNLTLTTSYQTFSIDNISIDTASTKNVAVFIWCDDTDATVGDLAFITDIKLEKGSAATGFHPRSYQDELLLCRRYYLDGGYEGSLGVNISGNATAGLQIYIGFVYLPTNMRINNGSVTYTEGSLTNATANYSTNFNLVSFVVQNGVAGYFVYQASDIKVSAEL